MVLILAADISGSMDREERELQRNAYAAALEDPRVLMAINYGEHGRIAIAYLEWSGRGTQLQVLPLRPVGTAAEATAAARRIIARSRTIDGIHIPGSGGGTSIGHALVFANEMIDASPYSAERRVIDISGDGSNNEGISPARVRDDLVARGVTINGLPVAARLAPEKSLELAAYYRHCVVGGPGAFQLVVEDPARLAETLTYKMVLEIAGLRPEGAPQPQIVRVSQAPGEIPAPRC